MWHLKSAKGHRLGLSAASGVGLALFTMVGWPWLLLVFVGLMAFLAGLAMYYRQFMHGTGQDASAGKGSALAVIPCLFPVTLLVRGSEPAVWAGVLLGLVGCLVTYVCLKRAGY
ncbi:hypothetical protein [Paenarthrobacter sp. NCHU4564]|uniref:hypothetical protein n=1 Tax=Paenarthrobacter sp. NCHU4564 TaxID=3451353 RepID=UPI003F953E63